MSKPGDTLSATLPAVSVKSLALAGLFAIMAASGMTLASLMGRFTGGVGRYHLAVFGAFFALYRFIPGGFETHFNVPGPVNDWDIMYYTAITHCTIGYGDIYPKTTTARVLVLTHAMLVFVVTANIMPVGENVFSYSAMVSGD
jgi:hypothetical protein